jgi:hypothetical protein
MAAAVEERDEARRLRVRDLGHELPRDDVLVRAFDLPHAQTERLDGVERGAPVIESFMRGHR